MVKFFHKKTVAVSGGFDPIHVGHIRYFREAKSLGDELIVMLNTDEWLMKKKGYIFMPYKERKEIILAIKWVDKVIPVIDKGKSVAKTLEKLKPDIFAKGGDRLKSNLPKDEIETCKNYGIEIRFNVGGGKIQSSSWIVDKFKHRRM